VTSAASQNDAVTGRLARDDEVAAWCDDGWVLLEGLVGIDEIDAAASELWDMFPTPDQYHGDPERQTEQWIGTPPTRSPGYVWPATGPGFRPEQHRWRAEFPFAGRALNRLCVHPGIVDFMQRALQTTELRIYQAQLTAKYTGAANYEQPMHTDRNHSWLAPDVDDRWRNVEGFLYLSDVDASHAPTHLVSVRDSGGRDTSAPLVMPKADPELYAAEQPAVGVRGSVLAYRTDVFHRAVELTAEGGARFLLNVSYKVAGADWIGFHSPQARATSPHWVSFVEHSTPCELELFGFPRPGHPVWTPALLDATGERYPALDLTPWRAALSLA
jgi:hypothetical protein